MNLRATGITVHRILVVFLVVVLTGLSGLQPLGRVEAAEGDLDTYTVSDISPTCSGQTSGSHSYDQQLRLFLLCGPNEGTGGNQLRILNDDGTLYESHTLPFTAWDVAPSGDGSVIYVSRIEAPVTGQGNANTTGKYMIRRLQKVGGVYQIAPFKNPDGSAISFTIEPGWTVPLEGRFLATDAAGHLYVASGGNGTTNNVGSVIKYAVAADGTATILTTFGQRAGDSWRVPTGRFTQLSGIAVTADGSQIFTTDFVAGGKTVVSRFDRQGANASDPYQEATHWGDNYNDTCDPGIIASAYDTAVDGNGAVYVVNTTCGRVEKYSSTGGYLQAKDVKRAAPCGDGWCNKPHGLAVSWRGNVYVAQTGKVLSKPGAGDTTPPAVSLTSPAPGTTVTAGQVLRATATDASGVNRVAFRFCPGTSCAGASSTTLIEDATAPYEYTWSTLPAPGSYVLKAVAWDNAGNPQHSAEVPVTIAEGPPPVVPPVQPPVPPVVDPPIGNPAKKCKKIKDKQKRKKCLRKITSGATAQTVRTGRND